MGSISGRRLAAAVTAVVTVTAAVVGAVPASAVPGDPWYFAAMNVPAAHQETTGAGVTIGVVESGPIDPSVPELQGADVVPVGDFCHARWSGPDAGWEPRSEPVLDPAQAVASGPAAEHGTSVVTPIVGNGRGSGPGGAGTKGIAPDATVRFYNAGPDTCMKGNSAVDSAIAQAVMDGVDVITVSLSATGASELLGVRHAVEQGVPVLWAIGNEDTALAIGDVGYLGVVYVGAVGPDGVRWPQSNYGRPLSVVAPGVDLPVGAYGPNGSWDSTIERSGTSGSAPIVAGLLALVMSKYPQASGNQVIQHLARSTTREGETSHELEYGFGIPSLGQMLAQDPSMWQDVNPLTLVDLPSELPGVQTDAQALASAASPTATATTQGSASRASSAVPEPRSQDAADEGAGAPAWLWIVGSGIVLLGSAAVGLLLARRRGAVAAPSPQTPGAGAPVLAPGSTDTGPAAHHETPDTSADRSAVASQAARPQGE